MYKGSSASLPPSPAPKTFWSRWLLSLALVPMVFTTSPTLAQGQSTFTPSKNSTLSYGQLIKDIKNNQVVKVEIDPILQKAKVTLKNQPKDEPPETVRLLKNNTELIEILKDSQVNWGIRRTADNSALIGLLGQVLIVVILIGLVVMIIRRTANISGQAMSFG
ncbi:MAG: hypothetical protein ACKO5Q_02720, partial [Microcystaceae cyanobacterium]